MGLRGEIRVLSRIFSRAIDAIGRSPVPLAIKGQISCRFIRGTAQNTLLHLLMLFGQIASHDNSVCSYSVMKARVGATPLYGYCILRTLYNTHGGVYRVRKTLLIPGAARLTRLLLGPLFPPCPCHEPPFPSHSLVCTEYSEHPRARDVLEKRGARHPGVIEPPDDLAFSPLEAYSYF